MLARRIIPCLDIKDGRVVKGTSFVGLRDAGDPLELAQRYNEQSADELVFLDITASKENRGTTIELATRLARELFIPFTIGGGISSLEDMHSLVTAGADKVSVNSSAIGNPNLIFSVQTHPRTKYQDYLNVLDQLKEAKATKISIANPPAF